MEDQKQTSAVITGDDKESKTIHIDVQPTASAGQLRPAVFLSPKVRALAHQLFVDFESLHDQINDCQQRDTRRIRIYPA